MDGTASARILKIINERIQVKKVVVVNTSTVLQAFAGRRHDSEMTMAKVSCEWVTTCYPSRLESHDYQCTSGFLKIKIIITALKGGGRGRRKPDQRRQSTTQFLYNKHETCTSNKREVSNQKETAI